ncbi:hypothetical protein ACF1A5_31225 [Streptomyces sp. NPDC014864]|uniref:hypothetical protein n=1 Tax=Streptomyces sp. NPDC014864 TaxID=3364924 RepID=UPI0036FC9799
MPSDPYAVLRALLRAEAVRDTAETNKTHLAETNTTHLKDPGRPESRERRPVTAEEEKRV